ncbi:hypothetical protein GUJ93_ZPchr0013g37062 [Zizania palustris]|uniref:Uncharacterized protein n=1 Tax=Zizania palustris TaxID=103762 RepID=A0A8J5WY95_ZIZPA|nr:hypothetical protein GUJ93_ZPchr0013g37062 [Zizania palustris]
MKDHSLKKDGSVYDKEKLAEEDQVLLPTNQNDEIVNMGMTDEEMVDHLQMAEFKLVGMDLDVNLIASESLHRDEVLNDDVNSGLGKEVEGQGKIDDHDFTIQNSNDDVEGQGKIDGHDFTIQNSNDDGVI